LFRLLKKCLERDPRRRLHDIGDAWDLIDTPEASPRAPRSSWFAWTVAALLAVATAGLALVHFRETAPARDVVRFQVQAPTKNAFDIYLALSPDGKRLAFTARDDTGVVHLWVRELDSLEARQLPGTENAWSPFWSPDSRQLAFAVNRTLKRVGLAGGLPLTLGESPALVGVGSWNAAGVILFGTRGNGVIRRIPASGGCAGGRHDDRRVARKKPFTRFPSSCRTAGISSTSASPTNPLGRGSMSARWMFCGSTEHDQIGPRSIGAGSGDVRVIRRAAVLPSRFERSWRSHSMRNVSKCSAMRLPLAEGVGNSGSFGFFSASSAGVIAYRTGFATFANMQQLTWVDRTGKAIGTVGDPQPYSQSPRSMVLSPDGTRAVAAIAPQPNADLWLIEFARGVFTRFHLQRCG
jgi:hypothetical protein